MRILITGGTGFLGAALIREFITDNEIIVLAKDNSLRYLNGLENECTIIYSDILEKDALCKKFPEDIDLVMHLAAEIKINDSRNDDVIRNNVAMTENILECLQRKGIKRFMFSSSMTVYGKENKLPVSEDGILAPFHDYGESKRLSEEVIRKSGVNALIIRYSGLYGYPRKSGYIYNLLKKMMVDASVEVSAKGLGYWETIRVDHAAKITKDLLAKYNWDRGCDIFNCSYGERTDFVETAYLIRKILGSSSDITVRDKQDYREFYLDNSKIQERIKSNFNYRQGLREFIDQYSGWIKNDIRIS